MKDKGMTIIKDDSRSLYLYNYDDFFLLISEPLRDLNGFNQCLKLEKGIFSLDENGFKKRNGKLRIITRELNEFLNSDRQESILIKCEFCDDTKYTQRFQGEEAEYGTILDCCINCFLDGSYNKEIEKRKKQNKSDKDNNKNNDICPSQLMYNKNNDNYNNNYNCIDFYSKKNIPNINDMLTQ